MSKSMLDNAPQEMRNQVKRTISYMQAPQVHVEYHQLTWIWETGGAKCIGCTSGNYHECVMCYESGEYEPKP